MSAYLNSTKLQIGVVTNVTHTHLPRSEGRYKFEKVITTHSDEVVAGNAESTKSSPLIVDMNVINEQKDIFYEVFDIRKRADLNMLFLQGKARIDNGTVIMNS